MAVGLQSILLKLIFWGKEQFLVFDFIANYLYLLGVTTSVKLYKTAFLI